MNPPQTLREWLGQVGLDRLEPTFRGNGIDLDVVPLLTSGDLKELGLSLGDRKRVLAAAAVVSRSSAPMAPAAPERDEAERRQLTVMFCDLVGSTALSARLDPEDMRLVVRAYQDCCSGVVARYDGFTARFMGDGILAYFGYPRAHEDDAERAVRASLEIVVAIGKLETRAREELHVRVGIATGIVVVGDIIGKGASREHSVVGDAPNLAARLQGLAEPGTVVIASSTRRLLGERFQLRNRGRHEVKGLAEPVEVWAVEGISSWGGRFEAAIHEGLTPLVGRDHEIGLLLNRWALAQEEGGQVVLLSGEPGIGKSRILRSLRERLDARGANALHLRCSPFHVNSAFWPSIDSFEQTLKFGRDEPPESRLDKLEALLVDHYGLPLGDVRFIAAMLSIACEQRYGPVTVTPQKHKDETLRVLVDLCAAAARLQPTLILFEDLHWADPTSLEVLDLLIDRVRAMPLLIVLTYRPEFQPPWRHHGHIIALNLSKLTRDQCAAMVLRLAGGKALPGGLLEQILTKTDGVPLFVEELTKSILESGKLRDAGDRYEYSGATPQIAIPATLRDLLMARLDRSVPVKEIAQIGAAIGREFSHELIAAAAPLSAAGVDDALAQLIESGLAFRKGTPPEATYTFKHALIQDAAYDSLLKGRRQELHHTIARVIRERFPAIEQSKPEVLAYHNTQAGQHLSAILLWQKAGELALVRMALVESISHLNQGLDLIATLPASAERDARELSLRVPLGLAWQALNGWATQEVWNSLHPALALAKSLGRNDALLPILWGLALNVLTQGRIAESFHWVKETLDTAEATGDADLSITGHVLANAYYYFMGLSNEALEHRSRALALYDDGKHRHLVNLLNQDPKTRVGVYASICTWMLGYPDRAMRLSEETNEHARRRALPFDLGFALRMQAELFDFRHEPGKMHKCATECEQLGRDNSLPVLWALIARFARGVAFIREGKAAEGVGPLEAGLKFWDATGGKSHTPYLAAVLAEGMALLGDLDGALQLIDAQIAQIERPGWQERVYYAEILRLRGWMYSLKGDFESAERSYHASLDWARVQAAKSWELRTATSLARLWRAQGRHEQAHQLLAPVYGWFTEGFDTKDLKDARALIEELGSEAGHRLFSLAQVGGTHE
jgi:class 3 adenylate cyclase/tetratricopeptide (TPR) repeat protein